jgi:hypothetical protein
MIDCRNCKTIGRLFQVLAAVALFAPAARSQPQVLKGPPHIGFVYPAGGRQGSTFEVAIGGENLSEAGVAVFSGGGVTAKAIGYERPMTPKEFNELREQAQQLAEKREAALGIPAPGKAAAAALPASTPGEEKPVWTAEDQRTLFELRRKVQMNNPNRLANPAISETVKLQVTMAPDAKPGPREMRFFNAGGLSNPLVFCVGQLPEFSEAPVLASSPSSAPAANPGAPPATARTKAMMDIPIPAVVNGQILPGAVDRYRFPAKKGQQIVVAVAARSLIPYLADAVPGWIQAALTLRDSKGRELAYDDDFRFNPDPVISFVVPADGSYTIEINDAIYRGREDFVYRISIGELPFITSISPLGGPVGRQTVVQLKGWNLRTQQLTVNAAIDSRGVFPISVASDGIVSNEVPFGLDDLPETTDAGSGRTRATAQAVALPILVNGRIERPGQWKVFRFEGRAGQAIVAEVVARRLDSPLDSVLRLTDATGRQLAYNDDMDDESDGLHTHHADSYLTATLPAAGEYFIHIGDIQQNGGPEYEYRLRLSEPRPDFELRVTPSSVNVRSGGSTPLTVHVLRKDGFKGPVSLSLVNPPSGFSLGGAHMAADAKSVQMTLSAPFIPLDGAEVLQLAGSAQIGGRPVTRIAVPAEDMMQAFAYKHLVPAKALIVTTVGRAIPRVRVRVYDKPPIRIASGGTGTLMVGVPPDPPQGKLRVQLGNPPDGITLQDSNHGPGSAKLVIACDSAKAKPGMTGNLILETYLIRDPGKAKGAANSQSILLDTLPAIPFVVVAR